MSNRSSLLLIPTAVFTAFALGKSLINSKVEYPAVANYSFPKVVELPEWKFSQSEAIDFPKVKPKDYILGDLIAAHRYYYQQGEQDLKIEMRYLAHTNGDLKGVITKEQELSSILRQGDAGDYGLYISENKAELTACINPRGFSTVTSDRFNRNLMVHDNRIARVIPWLLGKKEFRDKRCLWAHLSLELKGNTTAEEIAPTLEAAWQNWYDYWQVNYPPE